MSSIAALELIPVRLRTYIGSRILSSLDNWKGSSELKGDVAESLVNKIIIENQDKSSQPPQFRKSVTEVMEGISKVLMTSQDQNLESLRDISAMELYRSHRLHQESNKKLFKEIVSHHQSLATTTTTGVNWEETIDNSDSLQTYAAAAASMGQKQWVKHGNRWMGTSIVNYFRNGGSKKVQEKLLRSQYFQQHNTMASRAVVDELSSKLGLAHDLFPEEASEKIKVLDVGSCYNPFQDQSAGPWGNSFSVTALDLYPVDSSVAECDFLRLRVGDENSQGVYEEQGQENEKEEINKVSSSKKLLQLPGNHYDAVTMSLVLSYLPSPAERHAMIRKARQLLVNPARHSNLQRDGLLVIFEKESIFHPSCASEDYIRNWKEFICSCGFEFYKYEHIRHWKDRLSHGFVFRTIGVCDLNDSSIVAAGDEMALPPPLSPIITTKQEDEGVDDQCGDIIPPRKRRKNEDRSIEQYMKNARNTMYIRQDAVLSAMANEVVVE